jgi:hypothetical protein
MNYSEFVKKDRLLYLFWKDSKLTLLGFVRKYKNKIKQIADSKQIKLWD